IATSEVRRGIEDNLSLAGEALEASTDIGGDIRHRLSVTLDEMATLLSRLPPDRNTLEVQLKPLASEAARMAADIAKEADADVELVFWTRALEKVIAEHERDLLHFADAPHSPERRLTAVATAARDLAMAMDSAVLVAPER